MAVWVERVRRRRGLALAALCAVLFITFLDNTIVSVALADIQQSSALKSRPGVSSLQWIVNGYMLAFAALMLTGGTLGDLYGRKRLLVGGVVVFCVGSAVAAMSPDSTQLIVGRLLMGVGAAACEPGTLSMIRQLYPEARPRARALGAWTATSGAALALGPILGGALISVSGWEAIFWFNVAFGLVLLGVSAVVLTESADPEGRHIDLPGLICGTAMLLLLTFAIIAGESSGYTTTWIDALFVASAAAGIAFIVVELRSPDPVLNLEFFRDREFSGATLVGFASSFGLFAVFFFTALYLQIVSDYSGAKIAGVFVAMAAAVVVAGWMSGIWTGRRGPRGPMTIGCAIATAGIVLVNLVMSPTVAFAELTAALAVVGFGLGLALVAVTTSVLSIVPARKSGMAASTVNTSRELGGVLGVAVLGAVLNGRLVAHLNEQLTILHFPADVRPGLIDAVTKGGVPTPDTIAQVPPQLLNEDVFQRVETAAFQAFTDGLHFALWLAAGIMLAAAITAWLTAQRTPAQFNA